MEAREKMGLESPSRPLGKRKQPVSSNLDLEHQRMPLRHETVINNRVGADVVDPDSQPPQRPRVHSAKGGADATRHVPSMGGSIRSKKMQDAANLVATARQIQRERLEHEAGTSTENAGSVEGGHPVIGLPVTKNHIQQNPADDTVNSDALSENKSGEQGEQKMRLVWSQELHNRFLNALSHLGLKKAVPKNILTLMNVEGMTRENIASHLQKYRMYLKKAGGYSTKEKVSNERLQQLHENNVQEMASREAMHQNISIMDDPIAVENENSQHAEKAQTHDTPHTPDAGLPNVVEGIPISDAPIPPLHMRMYHAKQALCPAVAAIGGGFFDPQSWQYPELPGEDSLSSQYQVKTGDNHIDAYSHLPLKHHDDHTDIFFDGKHDNQSESDNAAAGQDEICDEDLLIEKSTIEHQQ